MVVVSFIGGGNQNTRKKKHRPVASHCQTLSQNVISSTARHERGSTLAVIGTDCTGSCKPNYHSITTMTVKEYETGICFVPKKFCIFFFFFSFSNKLPKSSRTMYTS